MKRLISFVLTLAVVSALFTSVFAYRDTEPPLWKKFSYDSLGECVEDCFGGDLEAYYEKAEYQSIREKWDEFLKENPDYLDSFDEALWWDENYSYVFDSRSEAMEYYRLDSDADLTDKLRQDWLDSRFELFRTLVLNQMEVAELGGRAGEINVMLNGEFIDFADSYPVATEESRVVVPFRALFETLGAKVDYDSETNQAKARYVDRELVHTVGTDTITLTEGEDSREITMDCKSYISSDFRTMLPVRFMVEALGCYVGWSTAYQTVIIIDPSALEKEYEGRFDVLNMLLLDSESRFDPETAYSQSGSLSLRLAELDGGADYTIAGEFSQLFKGELSNSKISLDLSEVIEYLSSQGDFLPGGDLGVSFAELKKLDMELIVDSESGVYYVKSPVMGDPDTWLVGSFYENALGRSFLCGTEPVVDGVISAFAAGGLDIYSYDALEKYLENLSETLGDSCFKKSGDTYKASAKSKALQSLFGIEEDTGLFMELVIKDLGGGLCDFSFIFGRKDEDVLTALSMGREGGSWSFRLEATAEGMSRFTLALGTVVSESEDEPVSEPPEDENVVEIADAAGAESEAVLPDETELSGILEFITEIE